MSSSEIAGAVERLRSTLAFYWSRPKMEDVQPAGSGYGALVSESDRRLVLDALEEAQPSVRARQLLASERASIRADERRRVGEELLRAIGSVAYVSHPAVDPALREVSKQLRRICGMEEEDD